MFRAAGGEVIKLGGLRLYGINQDASPNINFKNMSFYQDNLEPPGWRENLKLTLLLLGVVFFAWLIFDYYNLGLPGALNL